MPLVPGGTPPPPAGPGNCPAGMEDTGIVFPAASDRLVCSARGCRAEAVWALHWNNPRLHSPERRKTWLACAEHRDDLEGFLSVRGFLREVGPVGELREQRAPRETER